MLVSNRLSNEQSRGRRRFSDGISPLWSSKQNDEFITSIQKRYGTVFVCVLYSGCTTYHHDLRVQVK
jgi:hypothetical protein